jgi:uncharacterized damage-inducible protein DinB
MEVTTVDEFLRYWERVRERTLRVAQVIPRDRFDWAPREGAFSFADLLRHLAAIERFMFAENAALRPSRYPGHGRELADGPDAVFAYLDTCHRDAVAIFAALTPEDLAKPTTTPGGGGITAWKWMRAMIEHEIHHRGQIYLMLGLLGIHPPQLYGLTEEEVKARSEN